MQLREDNKKTQSHYYAKASERNVLSHIRQWLCLSIFFGLCYFPARVDDVIPFLELMALSSGYDHNKAVLGSISFLHKNLGLSFPADGFQIKLTLQALKRWLARAPNQALPIRPAHLLKMYNFLTFWILRILISGVHFLWDSVASAQKTHLILTLWRSWLSGKFLSIEVWLCSVLTSAKLFNLARETWLFLWWAIIVEL